MRHRLMKPRQSISARTIHNFLSRFARGALGPFFLLWCSGTLQISYHHMGKKSRTPSVETRVVKTKKKFSGRLENISTTLFTFCLLCFHFFILLLQLFFFRCFLLLFYTERIFLRCSAFFGQRVIT
jgi:fatty acid desaturase